MRYLAQLVSWVATPALWLPDTDPISRLVVLEAKRGLITVSISTLKLLSSSVMLGSAVNWLVITTCLWLA